MGRQLPPIVRFAGQFHFLSNFYWHPFRYNGEMFNTSEHAFQSRKATNEQDRQSIKSCPSPGQAKQYARRLPCRPDWEDVKVDIMKDILRAKFSIWNPDQVSRNPLAIRLIQTGDADLIEGNSWGDTFWGQSPVGNGENMLGKLLMKVRSEIMHAG